MTAVVPSVLPFTALMPLGEGYPIEILDPPGRRFCLVDKGSVHLLDDSWNRIGVYILLDLVQEDGTYGAYVGKATNLRSRLLQHEREKQFARALLVDLSIQMRFTSAHAGWLEGELHAMLQSVHEPQLHTRQVPRDDTIPSYDVATLGDLKEPVRRIMGLLGHRLSTLAAIEQRLAVEVAEGTLDAEEAEEIAEHLDEPLAAPVETGFTLVSKRKRKSHTVYSTTVKDLLDVGLLFAGDKLFTTTRDRGAKVPRDATGELNADGTVSTVGQTFAVPSGAAAHLMGRAMNGWDFWCVERDGRPVKLSELRKRFDEAGA